MEKFLDAYIKLVTQFLTIVAPLTTILLSEFNNRKKSAQVEIERLTNEANAELGNMGAEEAAKIENVTPVVKKYEKEKENIVALLSSLSLRYHIPYIFVTIFISLTLVLISLFFISMDKVTGQIVYLYPFTALFCSSLLCFGISLFLIGRVFYLIITNNK